MIRYLDLCSGIGGFRLGFQETGKYVCVFSSEKDAYCQKVYRQNFKAPVFGAIEGLCFDSIPEFDVLVSGFPCQPFSSAGKRNSFDCDRGKLIFRIFDLLEQKKPRSFLLENVKGLTTSNQGRDLDFILKSLRNLGYYTSFRMLNTRDFGLPQSRERVFIVGDRERDFDWNQIRRNPVESMEPFLDESVDYCWESEDTYTLLDSVTIQKSGLIFSGYLKKKTRVAGVNPKDLHLSRTHKQPYRVYSSKGIHPTILSGETSGRYYISQGSQVRKLSLEEVYSFMGFPKDFIKDESKGRAYRQIGNSVGVPLVGAIAEEMASLMS